MATKQIYEEGQKILTVLPPEFITKHLQFSKHLHFIWKLTHNKLPIQNQTCLLCKETMDSTHFLSCAKINPKPHKVTHYLKTKRNINSKNKKVEYEKLLARIQKVNTLYHKFRLKLNEETNSSV